MSRPFSFTPAVKFQARFRQNGKCACCGDSLDDVIENAHHVIPNQSGDETKPDHKWLATEENCVVLCFMCHGRVHQDNRYRAGAVAPPSYYPYSHGDNRFLHQAWVNTLTTKSKSIWP